MSRSNFSLSFQKSPIILTNGLASSVPGGMLPIISLTQAEDFNQGLTSGSNALPLDQFLFDFQPAGDAALIENQVPQFPLANQIVAANAIVAQPLRVSLLMESPARVETGGYARKLSVFQSLKKALDQHTARGGTYTVVTPSYIYDNCLLESLREAGSGDPKRTQDRWVWSFIQPLLTAEAAREAQNQLMQKVSAGAPVTPGADGAIHYSGVAVNTGNPSGGAAASAVPASRGLTGAAAQVAQNLQGFGH